ncbi:hypothetical protein Tco_0320200 [Tanacetum coccineum]
MSEALMPRRVVPLRSDTIRLVQNGCSFHRLRSEDPNQHLKDVLKLVDSIDLDGENRERTRLRLFQFSLRDQASNWLEHLPTGSITTWEDLTTHVPSTSDRHLIELENQVQHFMEAHIAPMQPTQVNKIISSCEICSGPHDTQYCMENPEQTFVEYASSRTDEAEDCLWQILHPDSLQYIIKSRPNIVECTVTKLVEFINTYQSILLVFILIYEPLGLKYAVYADFCLRSDLETPKARRSSTLRFVSLP